MHLERMDKILASRTQYSRKDAKKLIWQGRVLHNGKKALSPDVKIDLDTDTLELDGKPHCIAWWDAARDADMAGFAELICIHSLKAGWHQGYGSLMMQQILADVKSAGYAKILLWVFESNVRAIKFYEAHGFVASGRKQSALGAVEEMYIKEL